MNETGFCVIFMFVENMLVFIPINIAASFNCKQKFLFKFVIIDYHILILYILVQIYIDRIFYIKNNRYIS